MGETFKAFITFVSEDSIMMGLCIAILVLVVMFILVLILGRKKDVKKEVSTDNSEKLLKTEINMEPLKSSSEVNIESLSSELPEGNVESEKTEEIPVTTEEPVKLEIEDREDKAFVEITDNDSESDDNLEEEVSSVANIMSFDDFRITEPQENTEENVDAIDDKLVETNSDSENDEDKDILESNIAPIIEETTTNETVLEPIIEDNDEEGIENLNIVESTTVPISEEDSPSIEENNDIILEADDNPVVMDFPIIEPEETDVTNQDEEVQSQEEEVNDEEPVSEVNESELKEEESSSEDNEKVDDEEKVESEEETLEPIVENDTILEPIVEPIMEPVVENALEPEPVENPMVEEPTLESEEEILEEEKEEEIDLPDYSDVYSVDDIELPNIKLDEYESISVNDSEELPKRNDSSISSDDLDLPKLNTNPTNSLNSLHGESFKIEK